MADHLTTTPQTHASYIRTAGKSIFFKFKYQSSHHWIHGWYLVTSKRSVSKIAEQILCHMIGEHCNWLKIKLTTQAWFLCIELLDSQMAPNSQTVPKKYSFSFTSDSKLNTYSANTLTKEVFMGSMRSLRPSQLTNSQCLVFSKQAFAVSQAPAQRSIAASSSVIFFWMLCIKSTGFCSMRRIQFETDSVFSVSKFVLALKSFGALRDT